VSSFLKSKNSSFFLLNVTQFLGTLNDNIFKLLVVYLLIHVKGPASAPTILSLVGAIFVIPFLLFSSSAGILADRLSKRTIITFAKGVEILIILFAVAAIWVESEIASYMALFCLSAGAAIFGPSKYGIIPELVEQKMVSKANGSITSFTYLAIILGTFLASFLTDVTNKNFVIVCSFCLVIAVIGFITSLGIKRTAAQNSTKKINPFFLYEIYQTLKANRRVPHLLTAIFGSAFFLFIGAFTQLNIIPFAMQTLHLSEVGGGYLFLPTAVGITLGAFLSGQLAKDKVEPGISCISGLFIGILFICLHWFDHSLPMVIFLLGLLGVFGGAFLIPFDAFIQVNSPDEKRGQVIATSSFFSFIGVLAASFFLYLLSEQLKLSASSGFAFIGILSIITTFFLFGRLSSLFFPFFVRKVLKRFQTLKAIPPLPSASSVIVLQSQSWWDAILLFSLFHRLVVLLPRRHHRRWAWLNAWIESIQFVPSKPSLASISSILEGTQTTIYCLFLRKGKTASVILERYEPLIHQIGWKLSFAHGTRQLITKRLSWWPVARKLITMYFTDSKDFKMRR
jgi:acyl-[acyl-carrier-protein]-phospholipid O-acyltransferase/long-chain-fatty-acid--[acyl-carrier-protein] ligase